MWKISFWVWGGRGVAIVQFIQNELQELIQAAFVGSCFVDVYLYFVLIPSIYKYLKSIFTSRVRIGGLDWTQSHQRMTQTQGYNLTLPLCFCTLPSRVRCPVSFENRGNNTLSEQLVQESQNSICCVRWHVFVSQSTKTAPAHCYGVEKKKRLRGTLVKCLNIIVYAFYLTES